MPDREKVLKGLERCKLINKINCDKCPYDYNGRGNGRSECTAELAEDVLALLKEQEAKPQRYKESDIFHIPICPNTECSAVMNQYWHYCPYCGTRFAWDEELDKLQLLIASAAKDAK